MKNNELKKSLYRSVMFYQDFNKNSLNYFKFALKLSFMFADPYLSIYITKSYILVCNQILNTNDSRYLYHKNMIECIKLFECKSKLIDPHVVRSCVLLLLEAQANVKLKRKQTPPEFYNKKLSTNDSFESVMKKLFSDEQILCVESFNNAIN